MGKSVKATSAQSQRLAGLEALPVSACNMTALRMHIHDRKKGVDEWDPGFRR
jgi:hypothetical protein